MRRTIVTLGVIVLALAGSGSPADAQPWKHYPYTAGLLSFPVDEGNHTTATTEWWYWIAHVEGAFTGRRYSIIVAYPKYVLQFSRIVDIGRGQTWGGIDAGIMSTATGYLDVDFLGVGTASTFNQKAGQAFEYEVTYVRGGVSLSGTLVAQKPPHALAGTGYVQQLPGTFTWYYAQTRLSFSGSISTPGGGTEPVSGIAWIDRQWYDPGMSDGAYWGHWWYSIQLDDGRDIEAYKVWGADGGDPFPLFDLVGSDGGFQHFTSFEATASELWTDPGSGYTYPLQWHVAQADVGADLVLTATTPNQALYGGFWEGSCRVSGTMSGLPVSGWGFAEVSVADIRLLADPDRLAGIVRLSWSGGLAPFKVERASRPDFLDSVVLAQETWDRALDDPVLYDGADWFYRVRCATAGRCAP